MGENDYKSDLNDVCDYLADIEKLLIEIRDNTKPKVKRERMQAVGEGLPEIVQIWNEWAHKSLARVTAMEHSSSRYKNCVARWKENHDKSFWVRVIQKVNTSPFCLGSNERQWFADIEWLVRPDTCHRVLEGKYDEKKKALVTPQDRTIVGYIPGPDGEQIPVYR